MDCYIDVMNRGYGLSFVTLIFYAISLKLLYCLAGGSLGYKLEHRRAPPFSFFFGYVLLWAKHGRPSIHFKIYPPARSMQTTL